MKVITVACAAFVTGAIAAPAPDAVTRFPIKPIRLVASGAGGAGDFAGRLIAAELTQRLGQLSTARLARERDHPAAVAQRLRQGRNVRGLASAVYAFKTDE